MHIPLEVYPTAYRSIVSSSRGTGRGTFILVKPDVDALCAARILHDLLKGEYVNNTIIPVRDWDEVEKVKLRLVEEEDIRTLILINLGGVVDILAVFSFLPPTCTIHIIDSHRPTHLRNLHARHPITTAIFEDRREWDPEQDEPLPDNGVDNAGMPIGEESAVCVWIDKEGEEQRKDLMDLMEVMQYEPPPSPDDDDDSDSDDEEAEAAERARLAGGSGDEDADGSPLKRRRGSQEPQPLTKIQRRRNRARLEKYHDQGTYCGQSVANQVYFLAEQLGRVDEDAVWLAILGLTYQFTQALVDRGRYEDYVQLLGAEVVRLSSAAPGHDAAGSSSGPNDRSVRASEELRFCLFRHWTLYDSMLHSGYVAGKMKLWKDRGTNNLSGMLAKMGYSMLQCRETYAHMDSDLKARLFENMDELGPAYGLTDLTYPSFIRKAGYRSDLSASDAVEGLSAILEAGTGVRLDFGNVTGTGGAGAEEWAEGLRKWVDRGAGGTVANTETKKPDGDVVDAERTDQDKQRRNATVNFWIAWDALGSDTSLLRDALPLSMALHRSVTAQGTYILDKQAVQSFRTYRLVIIKEGPYLDVFRHPATLLRLALWLVDTVRDLIARGGTESRANTVSLPFVVASLAPDIGQFIVVGVIGAAEFGDVKKNPFGAAFRQAARSADATWNPGTFDSSSIMVDSNHLTKFLKLLALG